MNKVICLPLITLNLAVVLASFGQTPAPKATPTTRLPLVPFEYNKRWLKGEEYYEEAIKFPDSDLETPDSWHERNLSLLREALRVAPHSFANANLLTLQLGLLPRDLNEKFTPAEVVEIKQMLIQYLQHLRSVTAQSDAPERLAWHGLAVAAMTARLWPDDFQKQSFENGVSQVTAISVWERKNRDREDEWYGEFRASDTHLLVMDDDSWRLLDFESMKWQDIPQPVGNDGEIQEAYSVGLGRNSLATAEGVFDFTYKTWRKFTESCGNDLYLEDPFEAGEEWIIFYKNPPHYNLEKIADFDLLPKAEQDRLKDSIRDRFYFQSIGAKPRNLATDLSVNDWFVLPSSRLVLSGSHGRFLHPCQIKQSLLITPNAAKQSLEPKLEGYFNGTWSVWHHEGEKAMLEQFTDYEGRIPARAAVLDLDTRRWELLWSADKPAIPAPPPGVLQPVLDQPARWELPEAIRQSATGTVLNVTPASSRDGNVHLLSLTRDVVNSTFSVDLWSFHPGKRQSQRFHLVLPGYRPCTTWDNDFPLPTLKQCRGGFLIADAVSGRFWHLKWPVENADSIPNKP